MSITGRILLDVLAREVREVLHKYPKKRDLKWYKLFLNVTQIDHDPH
jgi:hypothetical protein